MVGNNLKHPLEIKCLALEFQEEVEFPFKKNSMTWGPLFWGVWIWILYFLEGVVWKNKSKPQENRGYSQVL